MKTRFENIEYLLREFNHIIIEYRFDFPEDIYKLLMDYIFHMNNELKEMETIYFEKFVNTWNNCLK